MDFLLTTISNFLNRYLGINRPLPDKAKTLVWMIALYDFSFALSSVFINIYLYKKDDDLSIPGWFNLSSYVTIVGGFWIGTHLSQKYRHLLSYQLGLICNASVFLIVLIARENTLDHPVSLGALYGLGVGLYYLGQHSLTMDMTETESRDYVLSVQMFLSSIFRILAPAIAGWTIAFYRPSDSDLLGSISNAIHHDSSIGYYLIFALSLMLNLGLIAKSFQFQDKTDRKEVYLWKVLTFKGNENWNKQMWIQFILGLRNGVFWFFIGLLVFRVSHNEGIGGSYNMLTNLLAVLTAYGLSRWATAQNRHLGMWISSSLICAAAVTLSWKIGYFSLMVFGVLNTIGTSWFQVAFSTLGFNLMEKAVEYNKHKLEYLTVREIPLGIGRLIGLSFLLIAQSRLGENGLRITLFLLGFVQMTVLIFMPRDDQSASKSRLDNMELEKYTN